MKKFKLLPSVIMLAFCILTLCTGVYCASVLSVTITGDLSIIPAKLGGESASVQINATGSADVAVDACIIGSSNYTSLESVNTTGQELTLSDLNLDNLLNGTCTEIVVKINVINNTSTELGVYFLNGDVVPDEATREDVCLSSSFPNNDTSTDPIGVKYSSYSHIGVASTDESVITDEASMYVCLYKLNDSDVEVTADDLDFKLVIEEYVANAQISAKGSLTLPNDSLVKLPTYATALEIWSKTLSSTSLTDIIIVLSNGFTGIENGVFSVNKISGINVPNSVTRMLSKPFQNSDISILRISENLYYLGTLGTCSNISFIVVD